MLLKGKGKFYFKKQDNYKVGYIHISSKVATDSQFPLKHQDELDIKIDLEEKSLVIRKAGAVKRKSEQ